MGQPALGLVIACRNEARVIERRLVNLARSRWPDAARPHRLVVVDDGSEDGTAAIARAACARCFPGGGSVEARVVRNARAPGKAGALTQGLAELDGRCDVIVATDADVLNAPDALLELARAFDAEAELGMASGAQVFVRDLGCDGRVRAAGGGEPLPAAGIYDRLTAWVRALESRFGRLFSVHGQLLAWRAELGLAPRGLAADDLDLMLQARAGGARLRLVQAARFYEARPPQRAQREAQALRRARAFVQCMRGGCASEGALRRDLQLSLYRRLPLATPWLLGLGCAALPLAAWRLAGAPSGLLALGLAGAGALSPIGRRCMNLMRVIVRAGRIERAQNLSDRWETAR